MAVNKISLLYLLSCFHFLILILTHSLSANDEIPENQYDQLYDSLMDLQVDPDQVYAVKNLEFSRDVGQFILQDGFIYFCKPVSGRTIAAFFSGTGRFRFTPPTTVERRQLYRFRETEKLDDRFKDLFLLFADSTARELQAAGKLVQQKVPRKVRQHIPYALQYLSDDDERYFDLGTVRTLLNGLDNEFFYSHFSERKTQPQFFSINPFDREEVQYARRLKGPSYLYVPEVINQFEWEKDRVKGHRDTEIAYNSIHIHHYDIDAHLKGSGLAFSATTRIKFERLRPDEKWFYLLLFEELEVDSAFWGDGQPLVYDTEKDNAVIWIRYDSSVSDSGLAELTLHYHGKLIERQEDWFYIRSSRGWYPSLGQRLKATFELRFRYPEYLGFASVGERVEEYLDDNEKVARWQPGEAVRNVGFNIGFFKEHEVRPDSLPPITVLMAETGHQDIASAWGAQGIGSGRNMEKEVARDVLGSIRLFQRLFGRSGASHYYATDIPYLHGEAFPGLLHLSWLTFQRTTIDGRDHRFRAHEVAHQWWGVGVDIDSYHDQWLSEGFAEFSAWYYWQHLLLEEDGDDKRFFEMLEDTRDAIVNNRKFWLGDGQRAGPVWLGYRTQSSDTRGDYNLIVYKKGAWVLHMLRTLMSDPAGLDDSSFRKLMRDFYQENYGKKALTADFQAAAEAIYSQSLDWFFLQWVKGADYPEYRFSYDIVSDSTSGFTVQCQIQQTKVPVDFKMPVTIAVEFDDRETVYRRVWVEGPIRQFQLTGFTHKPKKVIFNARESVLGKVDQ